MRFRTAFTLLALGIIVGGIFLPRQANGLDFEVSAVILDKGKCSLVTDPPYSIIFASVLNPLNPIPHTSSTTLTVNCTGLGNKTSNVVIQRASSGPLLLKREPNNDASIAYSLNLPLSRSVTNNNPVNMTITASISAGAYINAPPGTYRDSILLNIFP
jgi:hypothetical protein